MAVQKRITTTDTTITLEFYGYGTTNRTDDVRIEFYCKKTTESYWEMHTQTLKPTDSRVSYTFYGLEPATDYDLKGRFVGINDEYDYGPYVATTTGTSYDEMTGYASIYFTTDSSIGVALNGVNTLAGYDRTVNIYSKKPGGSYTFADSFIISGSSYQTSFYKTIYGFEENTDYQIYVEVLNPNGGVIDSWELNATTDFDTSGWLSATGVTEKSCTLNITGVPYSSKNPRTVKLYGKEGTNGVWENLKDFYVSSGGTLTHSLNTLKPNTYYEFKIDIYVQGANIASNTTSCTTPAPSGTLTVTDATEYSAKLTLENLATGISYRREIGWYYKSSADSIYTKYPTVSSVIASASSASVTIDTLASNTAYSFKAAILGDGVILGTKTATISTKETVANISVDTTTSASVKIVVNNLVNVAYKRIFEWWYKKRDEVDYIKFDETEMLPADALSEMSKVFKPLTPATHYDFKVVIKKDNTPMKLLTITARTSLDNSLVPDTEIEKVEQSIGERTVKVYWDAPAHELGTYYKIQYSTDDENYVYVGSVMTEPPSTGYTSVTLPELDVEYYIQVMSYFELEGEVASKTSESVAVYMFSVIDWDTPKVKGEPLMITATEWNKVVNVVKERLEREDVISDEYELDLAIAGKDVTAAQFNQLLIAINVFNPHDIEMMSYGDAITADLLNLLISKVNLE